MDSSAATSSGLLRGNGPCDPQAALGLLLAHTIPGAEVTGQHGQRRLLRLGGDPVPVRVQPMADGVVLTAPHHRFAQAEPVVRRWFDLDADQGVRNARFVADPVLGPLVRRRPGLRVTGHPDPFEALLCTVVGQQISLAAARTVTGRLVAGFGEPGPDGLTAFPTAKTLAACTPDQLREACGFMASRARTVLAVSRAVADGLDLTPGRDPQGLARTRRDLLALPGIGPWTVDFLSLRALGDPDAFPAGDLVLKKALDVTTDAAARTAAEHWRPHRAFAAMHLWTEKAYLAS
ncbi:MULTISPECIES: DNA-3-methyladenine glycosylase family protein [unclassified Luteococcus]|uniref:DNA-3-methyladenine glycosylase family protein n=1 Tax=unclassified Luteococcus TaxID=2639923 RepID=UPI00313CB8DC